MTNKVIVLLLKLYGTHISRHRKPIQNYHLLSWKLTIYNGTTWSTQEAFLMEYKCVAGFVGANPLRDVEQPRWVRVG